MSADFRRQIYNELNLRETDDLLNIWLANNRAEWSEAAFEIIKEILEERNVEIPQQSEPADEVDEENDDVEGHDFSDEELKIIDDENQPEFYDPFEVLQFSRWIDLMVWLMMGLIVIQGLFGFSRSESVVQGFFFRSSDSALILPITVLVVFANIAMGVLLTYVPLKALSRILRILMEMEFNSRKGKPLVE